MVTWTTIIVVFGFLIGLGATIDRLLLHRQKGALHLLMIKWWDKLDGTKFPDLAKLMADWFFEVNKKIFRWKLFSWKTILYCIIFSWIFTSIAHLIGLAIDNIPTESPIRLPHFIYYIVNFVFDLLTIVITIFVLRFIQKHNLLKNIFAIVFDILIATILACICYCFLLYTETMASYVPVGDYSEKYTMKLLEKHLKEVLDCPAPRKLYQLK